MTGKIRRTVCLLFGATILGSLTPSLAEAQHVVTESEAGKLTLASLTAVPVVHHHRHPLRVRYARRTAVPRVRQVAYVKRRAKGYSRLIKNVSYSRKTASKVNIRNAVYHVTSHRKNKIHRHRS